jgi:hypothetical protein
VPNITHTTTRPSSPKTKLLVVRQPVKSVREREQPERTPMRLAIGVIVAVGVLAAVWLMGCLGSRLGFAPLVRVPDLMGDPGRELATGTMILTSIPRMIFSAGLAEPMWLMLGFAMIALPAASLAAARPLTPGGPKPKESFVLMASLGAAASMLSAALLIWWAGSPLRAASLQAIPDRAGDAAAWHAALQTVAGLDVLAVITAALWVVLAMRLPVPVWLRAIAASATLFALAVVMVAMSMSNAAAVQIGAGRSLCVLDDGGPTRRIILGSTPHHMATLVVYDEQAIIELRNHPDAITVTGRSSIISYLNERAEPEP